MKDTILQMKKKFEDFVKKPYYIYVVCLAALFFHVFALDRVGIMLFAVLGGLFFLFLDDPRAGFTVAFTAVFIVSTQNSPGYGTGENYYAKPEVLYPIACAAAFMVACMTARSIIRRENLKSAKSFIPIAVLSLSFLLSGVGDPKANSYGESVIYAFFGVVSYLGLYFIFSGCFDKVDGLFDYFANLMVAIGLLVSFEVLFVYVLNVCKPLDFLPDNWKACMTGGNFDSTWKGRIITGWGVSNVSGEIIAMTFPFFFYKILRSNRTTSYLLAVFFAATAVLFTLSRNAMLFGGALFVALFVYAIVKSPRKKVFFYAFAIYFTIGLVACIILVRKTDINEVIDVIGELYIKKGHTLSGRDTLWKTAVRYFKENPLFGGGFAKSLHDDAAHYGGSANTFFQTLFHNFVFQAIGSGGLMGIASTAFLFASLVRSFAKNYEGKFYVVCFAIIFALMSLFDTIYYIPYTAMFLVFALAVSEKTIKSESEEENKKCVNRKSYSRS